ncbi:uncharacterized protein UTRI_10269 [Ustilago trichophora]|uniref:Uncharacterized protein n=1 Tax=Ustilago trichophora TaxID=86804 RepID=A0A5C3EMJ5_9BASI|nr:uncharacterized protein UTRI_10032 [Ustilago trichophora]SPO31315.1 uncharacterized protein UTRI_10269 [Ustilago trichophora]
MTGSQPELYPSASLQPVSRYRTISNSATGAHASLDSPTGLAVSTSHSLDQRLRLIVNQSLNFINAQDYPTSPPVFGLAGHPLLAIQPVPSPFPRNIFNHFLFAAQVQPWLPGGKSGLMPPLNSHRPI